MRAESRTRAELIGDKAIEVLAAGGARGLTHRAVDRAAGLPPGSTSNYVRTREALLTCALTRITQLEVADAAAMTRAEAGGTGGDAARRVDPAALAAPLAEVLHRGLTHGRVRLLARYELALESTRRPRLRALYDEASRPFREPVAAMLAAAGSPAPDRHARTLIAWCEGVQFDSIAGAGSASPPNLQEIEDGLSDLMSGMLTHRTRS